MFNSLATLGREIPEPNMGPHPAFVQSCAVQITLLPAEHPHSRVTKVS